MTRWFALAASVALSVAMTVLACDGKTTEAPSQPTGDAGADARPARDAAASRDASTNADDAAPGTCTFTGSACVGAPGCCPALIGQLVDVAASCIHPGTMPIGCATTEAECTFSTIYACYVRTSDAGTEVFLTPSDYPERYIPGAVRCDDAQRGQVEAARSHPCP